MPCGKETPRVRAWLRSTLGNPEELQRKLPAWCMGIKPLDGTTIEVSTRQMMAVCNILGRELANHRYGSDRVVLAALAENSQGKCKEISVAVDPERIVRSPIDYGKPVVDVYNMCGHVARKTSGIVPTNVFHAELLVALMTTGTMNRAQLESYMPTQFDREAILGPAAAP